MHHSILRRTIVRLRRNAQLCLPALALALTLGVVVTPPPPPESPIPLVGRPIVTPQVNWNS
jgi:hypothetical protein